RSIMPTSELLPDFRRDYARLGDAQKQAFRAAVKKFVIDVRRGSVSWKPAGQALAEPPQHI
ncbi:MAG TPA: hypothetical protein VGR57_12770, partial [Ktedonobacterales bacterium]|nr:hypothetical protein [Ktedonobacterales bacterium]